MQRLIYNKNGLIHLIDRHLVLQKMADLSILNYIIMAYLMSLVMLTFAMVLISMVHTLMLLHCSILILWDAMAKDHLQIFISNAYKILEPVELLIQSMLLDFLLYQVLLFQPSLLSNHFIDILD